MKATYLGRAGGDIKTKQNKTNKERKKTGTYTEPADLNKVLKIIPVN